ncbi:alanine racemase [Arvimicrobium flavum]|uniref:alanine racemase n=1 Tax=Arvimicrobium flavum TaxID=3393320 RepID=UPI00237B9201|nr:alanine racemase [Mesorhizobium shangrilense]
MTTPPGGVTKGPGALPVQPTVPEHLAGALLGIDLGALRENYRILKARLGRAACAGVVKADAYGLGAAEVAEALAAEGCRSFFVAHIFEALELRAVLPRDHAIFVLNGLPPGAERDSAEADVTPVLNSLEQLQAWSDLARRLERPLPAALQVDSGMSRLGLSPHEVERLAATPALLSGVQLVLVMSHLACADEPDNPVNRLQRDNFDRLRRMLPAVPASLANSSGIFLGQDYHHDLARPGAALYGVNPTPGDANPMRQVVSLRAKVVQTREVGDGVGIGYGYASRARTHMRLATISLGYADGWHRRGAAAAFHHGARLPFAGRVSMDSIILDISALPHDALRPGDLVDLIGADQTVDQVAEHAGTIGYEILTSFGRRFHRHYFGA